jgi:glycosyl transferase family 25
MKDRHKLKSQLFKKQRYYGPGCDTYGNTSMSTLLDGLHTQVINLDDSAERLARAIAQLGLEDIPFSRFPAVNGRGVAPEAFVNYSAWRARLWFGRPLASTEIACFLSHLGAAEAFVKSGKRFGLVFEDDFILPKNFRSILEQLLQALDNGDYQKWRLVNLGWQVKVPQDAVLCHSLFDGEYHLCRCMDFPLRAHGLLWSHDGAKRFCTSVKYIKGGVDNWLRSDMAIYGGGYCISPPPVGFHDQSGISYISPDVEAISPTDLNGKKRGWWRIRSKWRGEWRTACGHLRERAGLR